LNINGVSYKPWGEAEKWSRMLRVYKEKVTAY